MQNTTSSNTRTCKDRGGQQHVINEVRVKILAQSSKLPLESRVHGIAETGKRQFTAKKRGGGIAMSAHR